MRENHSVAVEPEPVSVQVVEWFGLVPFSFQFFTCLAAVFAEEVGGFASYITYKRYYELAGGVDTRGRTFHNDQLPTSYGMIRLTRYGEELFDKCGFPH